MSDARESLFAAEEKPRLPRAGTGTVFNTIACAREDVDRAGMALMRLDKTGCDIFLAAAERWIKQAQELLATESEEWKR